MSKRTYGHVLVLQSRRLVRPGADYDFYMSKRTYGPTADDDFAIYHLHWDLTLYNKKIGKPRSAIKNVLKLQVWDKHWIVVYRPTVISVSAHPFDRNTFTHSLE